jgi:hypothetical protein
LFDNPDTDGDGLCDGDTAVLPTCVSGENLDGDTVVDPGETDPCNPDSDGDGLSDGEEALIYLTDGTLWDTDGDFIPDLYEVLYADSATYNPWFNPFDPADGDTSFEPDGFDDENPNFHEYWNNTDPWATDPVPPDLANPACFYWADADGDGIIQANDKLTLQNAIVGLGPSYAKVIPDSGDSQDLDADMALQAGDMNNLQNFIVGNIVGLVQSRPASLEKVYEPAVAITVGSTTHVTVKVRNSSGAGHLYNSSFAVVFGTGRYDVSSESAPVNGGFSTISLQVIDGGTIQINARIPACGVNGVGRWCDEVVLSPAFTITVE